jgi:hypothetical protein
MSAVGPAFTVLIAGAALLAISRRRAQMPPAGAAEEPTGPPIPGPAAISRGATVESRARESRQLPRFFTGTIAGIATGIVLGAIAAVLITIASPDMRSSVVVGAVLPVPPPTYDGILSARIIAQDMNPTLVYAEADVAVLFAPSPVQPAPEPVVAETPIEQDLQDNAAIIFAVLAVLTLASWGVIMAGPSSRPAVVNAGVE